MLATVLSILLAAPGVSPEALDAIQRAQAAQATRSHRARFEILERSSGRRTASRMEIVPPDRVHYFEDEPVPLEQIQIGDRAWIRRGGGDWEEHPLTNPLATMRGPRPADDWGWELRAARETTARDLAGVRCRGYEYTLAGEDEEPTTRVWVAESTGLPARYEQDIGGDTFSWTLEYESRLVVAPPPGQAEPPARPARAPNVPRITLALARQGSSAEDLAGQAAVVVGGSDDVRVGSRRAPVPAGLATALAPLVRRTAAGQTLLLYVGHDVRWSAVETVLDAAREAGATRVGLGVRSGFGREALLPVLLRGASTPAPSGNLLVTRPVSGSGPGQVFELNLVRLPRAGFAERMRDVLSVRRDKQVDVRAAGAGLFQDVVALIDLLVGAGADVILTTTAAERFGPQPPPPPPPPPPPGN